MIGGGGQPGVHHNLVKRTRQSGFAGREVYNNEVYIDSYVTNAFGVGGGEVHGNRVFGGGHG